MNMNRCKRSVIILFFQIRHGVGFITLSDFDESESEAWLSIGLQPNVWGQGIGSYVLKAFIKACFDQRNIETIRLSVFSSNERAYCLYLKLGFQVEKNIRERGAST